jgi:AcrR family transcriptional regulator
VVSSVTVTPRDPAESRRRLIESAATLFYERGIQRTSMDDVVAEAGLTKPTLYRHFRSKDELVATVVEFRSANWARAIEVRIAKASTPNRRLMAVFDFLEEFIASRNFRGCALVNVSIEVLNPSDPGRKIVCRNKRDNRARLEHLARDAGLPRPRALASALSILFEGAIVRAYVEADATAGREARRAAKQLIRGQRGASHP